jgi:hypothetical protein
MPKTSDDDDGPNPKPRVPATGEPEAVVHLRQAVQGGQAWHEALLEAVGMWTLPEEQHRGRTYRYLIRDEAFDWLLLAERLCGELDGLVSAEDKERLLFQGELPDGISAARFRDYLGYNKHRAFLNFWYGVVVEEALQLAVEEEVRKQHRARGFPDSEDLVEQAFMRLYCETRTGLLREYVKGRGRPGGRSVNVTEMKEFTYGLFKRRVEIWDPARVASDTKKGLMRLEALRASSTRAQAS